MATCSNETNAQNFYRLVSLLIDTGSDVLRKLLVKYVLQQTTSLDQYLLNNQTKLQKLQTRNILHQTQMDLLFPSSGTADIETFDITLLSCLLKNICGKLPPPERQEIDNLRECRNEVSGHVPRAEIQVNDFNILWKKISKIINTLAQYSGDKKFPRDIQAQINALWINPKLKTSSDFSDILLQWYKSDQELQQQMERHRRELESELLKTKTATAAELKKHKVTITTEIESVKESTRKQHAEVTTRIQSVKDSIEKQHSEVTSEIQSVKDLAQKQHAEVTSGIQSVKDSTEKQHAEFTSEMQCVKDLTRKQHAKVSSEIQKLEAKVQNHPRQTDSSLQKLIAISKIYILAESSQPYVETHLIHKVKTKLLQEGSCVISGKPGEGKTTTAANIMKSNFNLEKCLVLSYPHEWTTVDIKVIDVVFIDDIFGKYQLDEGRLNEWLYVLDKISACSGTGEGKIKSIITTRASVLKSCSSKLSALQLFFNVVELASDKLRESEKQKMLNICLQHNNKSLSTREVSHCVEQFTSPIGFPFCCHLFSTNLSLFKLRENFFRSPFKYFEDNVRTLAESRSEKHQFAALVFLFYGGGQVYLSKLKDNNKRFCRKLHEISSAIGMSQALKPSVVKHHLDEMCGVYVACTDGCYVFIHNTVSEVVAMIYGESNPVYILSTCSTDYLHQCITVGGYISYNKNVKEDGDKIVIQEHNYRELSERLISEIIDKRHRERTAAHPALRNENFLKVFLLTIRLKKCKKLVFNLDKEWGPYWSFFPSYLGCICSDVDKDGCKLLFEILKCLKKCNHSIPLLQRMCWKCKLLRECIQIYKLYITGENRSNLIMLLLDYGAVPDAKALMYAIRGGNVDTVTAVMAHGAVPDTNTLNCAVQEGNVDIVKAVMEHGALPDTDTVICAVRGGNVDIVRALMEHGAVPDTETMNCAVGRGYVHIVRALMEHGAEPDTKTMNCAVRRGNVDIVRAIMERGAVPDTKTLNCAVLVGNVDIVRAVMEHVNVPDTMALWFAACGGNIDIVRAMVEHGDIPDTETMNCAALKGYVDIFRVVMEHGAVRDTDTVICAVRGGNVDIVRAVMEHGAVADTDTLNLALRGGNVDIVRAVMEHGAVPDTKTMNCAVLVGNVDIVRAVMEHGAVPDTKTLNLALRRGNVDIVRAMMEYGAVPDTEILNCAVRRGNVDIVRAVIEHGAVPDTETLNWALRGGNVDIVRELMEHGAVPDTETLNWALRGGNVDIIRAVMEHGAVPDTKTLNWALRGGNVDIVRALMENGAVPDTETMNCAALESYDDIFRAVMEHGASPDTDTVICAVRGGNVDIFRAVMEHGAVPDTETLNCAVQGGNIDIVRALMEHGAVPDTVTMNLALRGGNVDVVKAVMEREAVQIQRL